MIASASLDGSPTSPLTSVELVFHRDWIERWLRFGHPVADQVLDRRRRLLFFAPGAVFGYVRWEGNVHGTVLSRIDILRACAAGEGRVTVPGITPGGDSLLRLSGWPRVKRTLELIDMLEADGFDPAAVAPDYWRHAHNRLACGQAPRRYGRDQHAAWCRRRGVGS
ncbi:uncharacterized protein DUF2840 [Nitrospirillum amazonense]|uniref:Uncharacterized protein DUF2840 n=1 Tax=Nitrospirillum amazonense TaxID=28077 RepID=A0A560FPD0_9PROT|nr:DUF2840 domain-containing protein [Nitrospirillum amazonense]TWB23452.1 uncharacterized protein DUF2840 [Nitrospirillum amazonense]